MSLPDVSRSAPSVMDPEKQRQARLLRNLLQVLIAGTLLLYVVALVTVNPWFAIAAASVLLGVEIGAWLLLRSGHVRPAAWVLVAGTWLALAVGAFLGPPQNSPAFFGLVLVTVTAGLLLGARAAFLTATLSGLVGLGYLAASTHPLVSTPMFVLAPQGQALVVALIFFAAAGLSALADLGMNEARDAVHSAARAQAEAVEEMELVRRELESQVAQRTHDLERRTRYLQAATEVSRAATVILDPVSLMQAAAELICEKFDLYYTGVFLSDPTGEWALLQAGTGEAGQRMMARGHRIRVGSGMVGWSIANAQPRIALDVGHDAVRLATAELPETRSEAAIPLRSRGKVLGALSVQSSRPDAFGEVEIAIFQSLADQLAIALDNARLFTESRQALEQAQRAYRQASGRAWREFLRAEGAPRIQYRYGQVELLPGAASENPIGELPPAGAGEAAAEQARRLAVHERRPVRRMLEDREILFLPVQSREQVVGVMRFAKEPGAPGAPAWTDDEVGLLETISAQIGAALDAARLYQDTQRAAAREQLTGEVTARIRQTLDVQTVLRTAVEEIQRHLSLPEVVISLTGVDETLEETDEA